MRLNRNVLRTSIMRQRITTNYELLKTRKEEGESREILEYR